jgi:hypothetical protein
MHSSHPSIRATRAAWLAVAVTPFAACLTGCDDRGDDRAIETVKTVKAQPANLDATSAERFGYRSDPSAEAAGRPTFVYETPTGFEPVPTTPLRVVNFKVDGDSGVECYLSPVDSNDVVANVNRWRAQMRLDPLDAKAIEALPRTNLLGLTGTLVDIEGTYAAMGSAPKADYGLLGIFAAMPGAGMSLKMIGPKADVVAARERFLELANSLRIQWPEATGTASGENGEAKTPPPAADEPTPENLRWTLPAEWSETKPSEYRLMTFTMANSPNSECWLIALGGKGGGVEDNLKRWRRELRQEPLSTAEVAQLPRVPMLGREAVTIEVHGPYQGMAGPAIDDAIMLGAICELDSWTLFVKMVGPAAEIETQRNAFKELCASLR